MATDITHVRDSTQNEIPYDEWLDAATQAAEDWQLETSQVPPCFAITWRDGTSTERNPTAFYMGLFLRHSGKTEDEVFNHLTRWNAEKLGGYLKTSELKKITRNVFKDRYIR